MFNIVILIALSWACAGSVGASSSREQILDLPGIINSAVVRCFNLESSDGGVEIAYLRTGPTQTGVAFDKYYIWISLVNSKDSGKIEGAARVVMQRADYAVITDFLSIEEIRSNPDRVGGIFPEKLIEGILSRAKKEDKK